MIPESYVQERNKVIRLFLINPAEVELNDIALAVDELIKKVREETLKEVDKSGIRKICSSN